MRLDKPRLLDPDSAITREIAQAFLETDSLPCASVCPVPKRPYICSRTYRHNGPHVAYARDLPVAVWPQEDGK